MGLIKAGVGAISGVFADQWKEYFYCDALPEQVLAMKASKRVKGRGANTKGSENMISEGSVIAVADGQCMLIVEQGKVVEICAEPGEYTYDSKTTPSIFAGELGDGISDMVQEMIERFTFGGTAARDQRVYYINLRELMSNKYGTPNPIPFRVVDQRVGIDIDIAIRCFGEYSYRITNPVLFYQNVCGNVADAFTRDRIDGQLKTELLTALQPAFARIGETGVRYSSLPMYTMEIAKLLNGILSSDWKEKRGIEIVSFGISSIKASEEDEAMLKDLQRTAVFRDPGMAAANLAGAQATAMQNAASNPNGAMMGFMGMNMAGAAGGVNASDLFAMSQMQANAMQGQSASGMAKQGAKGGAKASWTCSCGAENTGRFCSECGTKKPEEAWICSCGTENTGKFCSECGAKKPEGPWTCSCGAVNTGKFCQECGAKRA